MEGEEAPQHSGSGCLGVVARASRVNAFIAALNWVGREGALAFALAAAWLINEWSSTASTATATCPMSLPCSKRRGEANSRHYSAEEFFSFGSSADKPTSSNMRAAAC